MNDYVYIGPNTQIEPINRYATVGDRQGAVKTQNASKIDTDLQLINASINRILSTRKRNADTGEGGERLMQLSFGSSIAEIPFEPNDPISKLMLQRHITEALEEWEPRITVLDVVVSQNFDQGEMNAQIYYVTNVGKIKQGQTTVSFMQ